MGVLGGGSKFLGETDQTKGKKMSEREQQLRKKIGQLLDEEQTIRERRKLLQMELWRITMEAFLSTMAKG